MKVKLNCGHYGEKVGRYLGRCKDCGMNVAIAKKPKKADIFKGPGVPANWSVTDGAGV